LCEMDVDGGGWQLISVRHEDSGALFADNVCLATDQTCSGTIPSAQVGNSAPDLLVATVDGAHWARLTGFENPGQDGFIDVVTMDRLLSDSVTCQYPHYCAAAVDPNLNASASSNNWTPRFTDLPMQFVRHGGFWFGNGGGAPQYHVVSLNLLANCNGAGGLDLSDDSDATLGNVACSVPGALYFR
jgi:hypothetical protein